MKKLISATVLAGVLVTTTFVAGQQRRPLPPPPNCKPTNPSVSEDEKRRMAQYTTRKACVDAGGQWTDNP